MSAGRIALIAAGLLIAACGLVLIVRAFRGSDAAAAASDPAPAARPAAGGRAQEPPPPKWQSFLRQDEHAAPARPIVHLAQGAPNPFDRLAGGVARVAKPGNPGFRLEGISSGARAVALISGHAVREGSTISGFRVVRIGRSAVTLAGPRGDRLRSRPGSRPVSGSPARAASRDGGQRPGGPRGGGLRGRPGARGAAPAVVAAEDGAAARRRALAPRRGGAARRRPRPARARDHRRFHPRLAGAGRGRRGGPPCRRRGARRRRAAR